MAKWRLLLAVSLVLGNGWLSLACPGSCSCRHEQGLYIANCTSLPSTGGKIEALTLLPSSDPLQLVDGQFNSARHLKYLNLKNSSIYFIHKKAFYGARNVIEIDLSFNHIEELEPTVFQHLTRLDTLNLRGNPIQFTSEVPFLISNTLQHLDIGQCKIKYIPRGVFYGLKRLKYLSLDNNILKSIKYNSLPKGLKYLDISYNLIVNVPTEVISSLKNLKRLGLGGNPINCSCSLMNLQDWLSGRGVVFEEEVICDLPSHYRGISWSKVDENALCLAEARRDEMYDSIYNPLSRNRLFRENYFENENSYQAETLQSDQPQPLHDPESEVLFQNDETLAMGEMMRDEDAITGSTEKEKTKIKEDSENGAAEESGILDKTETDIETTKPLEISSNTGNQDSEHGKSETQNENVDSNVEEAQYSNAEDILETGNNSSSSSLINAPETEEKQNSENEPESFPTDAINLNDSKPVEYKTLNEDDSNPELDDFKKEGLFHVDSDTVVVDTNSTLEETTVLPDIEDTTEDEVPSTEEALTVDKADYDLDDGLIQNSTSTTESNNATILEYPESPEEDTVGTTLLPIIPSDVYGQNNQSESNISIVLVPSLETELSAGPSTETNNDTKVISAITLDAEEKIKRVEGAEVVMFCVGVLVICLVLYSVYKCRRSTKRQSMRIVKDKQTNCDTEMQDMASLLPKPQDDSKKNNIKYPDKAPSSETEKLISNQNEKEPLVITPVSETKSKVEDKNALNNNQPQVGTSPTSKTPLIQPGKPVTIQAAAPIQRTKVRVGIIPDSIPRTPIFLQKTYNGTKNV